jgi:hypothetical protein
MTRTCTICAHPQREAIDRVLITGGSYRDIAGHYELSKSAVQRHVLDHLPAELAKAHEAEEVTEADKLLNEVERLHQLALAMLSKAAASSDWRTALSGIREARGCLELLAKLRGQLDERPVVNLLVVPENVATRTTIMRALMDYPDARAAVVAALTLLSEVGIAHGYVLSN